MKTKEKVVDFLSKYFKELRFGVDNHLGLGDIRLTFEMQKELIEKVEKIFDEKECPHESIVPAIKEDTVTGFIGIAFQKNSEQVIIIYEILTILIVSTLFYYFQFVRYSYG